MHSDYVQRFLFEHLDIRGRLVSLTGAWQAMLETRQYPQRIESLLGHTATLAVLLGANQKKRGRVCLQVHGSGPVTLLVSDCTEDLRIRGMARYGPAADFPAGERALLGDGRLALTLENAESGHQYQSMVPLEGESLQDIFESFLAQSEQRPALLRLLAGERSMSGLLLEKLPDADIRDPDGWNRIVHLAATLAPGETRRSRPYDLLVKLFPEELLRVFPLQAVRYHCPYDEDKVREMLRSLGRDQIDSIIAERGKLVITNEMCNHEYRFDAAAVEAMFAHR